MAFHETFWVVTGTTAPVLALAAVLSISDLHRLAERQLDEWLKVSRKVCDPSARTRSEKFDVLLHRHLVSLRRNGKLAAGLVLLQVLNMAAQAAMLLASLLAIADQRNQGAPMEWMLIPFFGLLALSFAGSHIVGTQFENSRYIRRAARLELNRRECSRLTAPGSSPLDIPVDLDDETEV